MSEGRKQPLGVGDKGLGDTVFPKEMMRRRWSMKEIVNIICDDLNREGKLKQKLVSIMTEFKSKKEVKK